MAAHRNPTTLLRLGYIRAWAVIRVGMPTAEKGSYVAFSVAVNDKPVLVDEAFTPVLIRAATFEPRFWLFPIAAFVTPKRSFPDRRLDFDFELSDSSLPLKVSDGPCREDYDDSDDQPEHFGSHGPPSGVMERVT